MNKVNKQTESSNSTKPVLNDGFLLITLSNFVTRINQSRFFVDKDGKRPFENTSITPLEATNLSECYRTIIRYCDFLKEPLEKEMFIGENRYFDVDLDYFNNNIYDENGFFYSLDTIESLVADYNDLKVKLTKKAILKIGIIA